MTAGAPTVITDYDLVREALRSKVLRQGLYDDGAAVMGDCLLMLHGDDHRQRRRLENRLFRRDVFVHWERDVLEPTIDETFSPCVAHGHGDLVSIAYRTTMNLTAMVAGIDRAEGTVEETEALYGIVRKFSEGATAVHSTRPRAELDAEVAEAMERFDDVFFGPSMRRREALIGSEDAPRDVLTTLLANRDELNLPVDVMRREVAFYLQAGSHSTANAFTHCVGEMLSYGAAHAEFLQRARSDRMLVQRCVHEALRLHPASPVAWRKPVNDLTLSDGTELREGELVVLDLSAANRCPSHFGDDAATFDPARVPADGTPAWGHSFGGGAHACVGQELDGGTELDGSAGHLYGTVAVMVSTFLQNGGRADPDNPPTEDSTTQRKHFSAYPVLFGQPVVSEQGESP